MTTEIPNSLLSKNESTTNHQTKLCSKLEERKGNSVKPLSLRPTRSVKKNLSMKPIGIKSR
jgi:hypothetical protein